MKKPAIITILAIVVGGFIYLGTGLFGNQDLDNLSQDIEIKTDEELKYVRISEVTFEEPGYVVVREMIDGKVGQIIEISQYLEVGTYQDLYIDVSYIEADLNSAIAVLYSGDGIDGFSEINVKIVTDEGGQPIARFLSDGSLVPSEPFGILLDSNVLNSDKEIAQTVRYTDNGFIPEITGINQGETVRFINESSVGMWVASDDHPMHTTLSTFDQFSISEKDEYYDYTFEKIGTWLYHDHVNPSFTGSIKVSNY